MSSGCCHGYAVTVHTVQGATADTTHAVLGENTTRALLYVAMSRGRDSNTAYLYERIAEHEYGSHDSHDVHVMQRVSSRQAGQLVRSIIASHDDRPITAHDVAAQTFGAAPPERVRRLADGRPTKVGRHERGAVPTPWMPPASVTTPSAGPSITASTCSAAYSYYCSGRGPSGLLIGGVHLSRSAQARLRPHLQACPLAASRSVVR
jgi:hypothetical protein